MGSEARLIFEPRDAPPASAEALDVAARMNASTVVEIRWEDPEKLHAHIDVHVSPESVRWVERAITFEVADAPAERGRALGLALISMIWRERSQVTTPVAPVAPVAPAAPAPVDAHAPPDPAATVTTAPPDAKKPRPQAIPVETNPGRTSVSAALAASVGIGGSALGTGPSVGLRRSLSQRFDVGVGAVLRFGSIDEAASVSRTFVLRAGSGVSLVGAGRPFELRARADLNAINHFVSRGSESRSRWIAGCDVLAEVAWAFDPRFSAFVAAGGELGFGPTDIDVGGQHATEIPIIRLVGEAGISWRF